MDTNDNDNRFYMAPWPLTQSSAIAIMEKMAGYAASMENLDRPKLQ